MTYPVYPYLSETKRTSELLIGFKRYWGKTTEIPVNANQVKDFFWRVGTRDYYFDKEADEIVMMEKIW